MLIKEKFNCPPPRKAKSSLEKWYCALLEKEESDVTLNDVCIMLRQSIFVDYAINKGIDYLKDDPFVGYCFLGEVLYCFFHDHKNYIISNKELFSNIIEHAYDILKNPDEYSSEGFDGMSKEEYSDMKILVNSIYLLVNSDGDVNGIVDGTQPHYPF